MAGANTQKGGAAERPPIIAVMGHIDHGKSTLLDYIRKTNVVETESGGITQHISAYEVEHTNKEGAEKKITFLDTPGHEAFKAMRGYGTHIADIAILVIAADDSIKAQTLEAYNQIKEAGIPFVVAINKTDKEGANPDKVRSELIENAIYLEGRGGDIPYADISAKTGKGIPELLELLTLVAEIEELTGNPENPATGFVLESEIDARKGTSATLIITDGTLHKGEFVIAGDALSPVRTIETFRGEQVEEARFSAPVRITGFNQAPEAGTKFETFKTKKEAEASRNEKQAGTSSTHIVIGKEDAQIVIPVILRADTRGTLEAVIQEMNKVPTDHVALKLIQSEVGDIAESDIKVATGAESPLVIGFRVQAGPEAKRLAEQFTIPIHTFAIIYNITDFLEEEAKKRTPVEEKEKETGKVKILKIFSETKNKQLIGGKVTEGYIKKDARVRIIRRDSEIGRGVVRELQQQKAPADKVSEGSECGMMIEARTDIAAGDIIAPFEIVKE